MRKVNRDRNEPSIVEALERRGCLVQPLAQVNGAGVPDLLVWAPLKNQLVLLEVKDPVQMPSARKLTDGQKAWHEKWRAGAGAPVFVVETVVDALVAVGIAGGA